MSEFVESVRGVAAYLRNVAEKNKDHPEVIERVNGHVVALERAADHMLHLEGLTSALPPELGNIHDLPQELLDELSVAKTDELEDQIVTVINAYGGVATLDQILVGLYRKFKVTQKRRFVQNKLYRMSMVWGVDGRKGVYTTDESMVSDAEIEREALRPGAAASDDYPWDEKVPF